MNYLRCRYLVLTALFCLFSLNANADANSITLLQTTLDRYQQVTTQFSQSTYDTNGSVTLSASGSMALLRPGYFRWQTDKPNQQIIVVSNGRLTIYDVDLQQASVQPMDKSIGKAPAALLLNSSELLAKQYVIEPQPKRTPGLWFRLTPKGTDAPMAFVDLQVNNQQLQSMHVMDNLGQLTVIRFTKQNFQPHLKGSNFTLRLPKNVDVVNEGVTVH